MAPQPGEELVLARAGRYIALDRRSHRPEAIPAEYSPYRHGVKKALVLAERRPAFSSIIIERHPGLTIEASLRQGIVVIDPMRCADVEEARFSAVFSDFILVVIYTVGSGRV